MDTIKDEVFDNAKYTEWYNPVIQKYLNGELTEYELVNEIFEPFEQVSQVHAQLLGATFEMLSGGPAKLMLELVEVALRLICLGERRSVIII
mgnify:CR=1 FL=1